MLNDLSSFKNTHFLEIVIPFPPPIQKFPKLTAVLKSVPEIIPGRSAVGFRSDHQEKQTKGGRAHRELLPN